MRVATGVVLVLALVSPSEAITQRQKDIATYATLSVADAMITYAALEDGHRELNPLMHFAGDEGWQAAGSVLVVSAVVGYAFDRIGKKRGHDRRVWGTANLCKAFAVGWNTRVLLEGK